MNSQIISVDCGFKDELTEDKGKQVAVNAVEITDDWIQVPTLLSLLWNIQIDASCEEC